MHLTQLALLEFHKKMNQTIGDPRSPDITADQAFRLKLINEELTELQEALEAGDVVKTADGLADLIYVLAGCGVTWGIDLASVLEEVHRSNMTKTPNPGGKAIKGPNFSPADIFGVLKDAGENLDFSEDGWWEKPTAGAKREPKHEIVLYDPSQTSSDNIMAAAKDQASILAMKSIKADFVQDENYPLQEPKAWEMPAEMVPELHKTATVIGYPGQVIKGEMTKYGAWVFDCLCGRRHAVQATLGSRGGLAPKGAAECICGKAYVVDFATGQDPSVQVTTIEELRKDSGK
jgi:hypothetical protein